MIEDSWLTWKVTTTPNMLLMGINLPLDIQVSSRFTASSSAARPLPESAIISQSVPADVGSHFWPSPELKLPLTQLRFEKLKNSVAPLNQATNGDISAKRNFIQELVVSLANDPVDIGQIGAADLVVRRALDSVGSVCLGWINDVFISEFPKANLLADLVLIVGRLDYLEAKPNGPTMALAALAHQSPIVKEAAIRAFEHWASPESLRILESVQVEQDWLKGYLEAVIEDIRGLSDTSC